MNRGHWGRHSQQDTTTELAAYRKRVTLPNQVAGLYGQVLSQELFLPERHEFKFGYSGNGFAWGHANGNRHKHFASKLYFSQDALNSTIKVTGENPEYSWRYGYTPFGQAYGFDKRRNPDWRNRFYGYNYLNSHVVPYLYTGKYTDPLTGLVNMDARWYDPRTARFTQGDQYNHANLMLPKGAQSELLRYIGRTQRDFLKDPAQQMRYGYVSGNPLRWVDPLGLCYPEAHGVEPITSNGGLETYQYRDGSYYDVEHNTSPMPEGEPKGLEATSAAAGLTPIGTPLDVYTAVTGKDAITGEDVSAFWRVAGLIPYVSELKKGSNVAKSAGKADSAPDFVVSPGGTAFPVPNGATGPTSVVNQAGKKTGDAFTSGSGGANGQVDTMRMMDPTPPRGNSPGYPNGYIKYENKAGQGVDPYTGRTLSNKDSHFPID